MRSKRQKITALLMSVALGVGTLAGCGGKTAPSENGETVKDTEAGKVSAESSAGENATAEGSGEEIEIVFPCFWVGTDSKAEVFGKMVEGFNEENKGKAHIKLEEFPAVDNYYDSLRTRIATGNAPDLFVANTMADVEYYASSGKVMDLTEFLEKDIADYFIEGAVDEAKTDGVNYCVPYEMGYIPVMYNQVLFDEAEAKIPETFDELWESCEKLKAKGTVPMCQMTGVTGWTTMLWYTYALAACGGPDVFEKDFTDQAYADAAELVKKMYDYTNSDAIGADPSVVNGHFFNGDDAIYTNGTWVLGRINSEEATFPDLYKNLTLGGGLALNEGDEKGFICYTQAALMCGVQEDPAKEEAVKSFIKYICDPERVLELANSSGSLFAINIDSSGLAQEKTAETYEIAQTADFFIPTFEYAVSTQVNNSFAPNMESFLLGDITAEEFAQALADADVK